MSKHNSKDKVLKRKTTLKNVAILSDHKDTLFSPKFTRGRDKSFTSTGASRKGTTPKGVNIAGSDYHRRQGFLMDTTHEPPPRASSEPTNPH
jgi:hypothetical protein